MKDPNRYLFPAFLIVLGLTAAAAVALLLGGGRRVAGGWDRKPGEIIFTGWGGPEEKAVFRTLVDEFERENPDIHVRYIQVPQNYMQKLQIMMAGGTPPDVFYIPDGDFPAFVVKDAMCPLTDFIAKSAVIKLPEFWPSALSRYRYDPAERMLGRGTLYALPKDIGPFAMYYNKDLFRRGGIPFPSATKPYTWDEAVTVWKRLTVPNRKYPRVMDQFGIAAFTWESAVWSLGGEVISKDGRRFMMADDPRTVEGMQWVADLALKYHCAPTPRESRSFDPGPMFDTGKLACIITGRWAVPHYRTLNFDWDVAPIPVNPRTRKPAGWSGSVGLGIARDCPNKAAAWRFVEFLAGPRGQAVQSLQGFQIPNQRALAYTDVFLQRDKRPRHAEVFIQGAINQRPGIATLAPTTEWLDEFGQRMTPVWDGRLSAAKGLKLMKPYVQKGLDNSWQMDQ
ncbi:MAG TPA: sugar ABC transporter substrate-binding protein [Armatimonadota bacterium]|jgi:multiple sugar transport system substrate-binding protein